MCWQAGKIAFSRCKGLVSWGHLRLRRGDWSEGPDAGQREDQGTRQDQKGLGVIAAGFKHCQLEAYGADVAEKKMIIPRSQSHRIAACLLTTASLKGLAPNSFIPPEGRPRLATLTVQWQSL